MKKALFLAVVAFSVCASSPHYIAQLAPTISLSASEAAKAKQAVQDFKSAQERKTQTETAWRNFYDSYQAGHPDLPGLQFASDFRIAFSKKNNGNRPWETVANLATVELSSEERQKAEFLYRDMLEARRLAEQAQKNWMDYWHELVLDHVPPTSPFPGGSVVTLPNGKSGTIPNPWGNGIVFTPDFRVAVPY
jgi:hypothetical protein